jgi:hypothetical protein
MARIVFTLTTAQVKALLHVSKEHAAAYGDYGAARVLIGRRLVEQRRYSNFREGFRLTTAGRHAVRLIRALKLDKLPPAPDPGR